MVSSIKKPFLVVVHSYDDIQKENAELVGKILAELHGLDNVKLIISTRAMNPALLPDIDEDRKVLLKAFSEELFKEFLKSFEIDASDKQIEDFYNL